MFSSVTMRSKVVYSYQTFGCVALEKDVSCQEETQKSVLIKSYIFYSSLFLVRRAVHCMTLHGLCFAQWDLLSSKEQFHLGKVHCTERSVTSVHPRACEDFHPNRFY